MGGNYEKGIYNQLMDVMASLDAMENKLHTEKREHKEDVDRLNAKIEGLTQENRLIPIAEGKKPGGKPATERDIRGRDAFPEDMICRYEQRYHAIISDGREEKSSSQCYIYLLSRKDELFRILKMNLNWGLTRRKK